MVLPNLTSLGMIGVVLHFLSTIALHFNESTTFNFYGCSSKFQEETVLKSCSCLQRTENIYEEECPSTNSFTLKRDECAALVNASYILQHRHIEDELEMFLNLNASFDLKITIVTGNCTFDCSGEQSSPCPLSLRSFNYSVAGGPFHLNDIKPGNYCLRMQLLDHELCILYTRLYTFSPLTDFSQEFIKLGENRIFLLLLALCFMTGSACATTYICKRGSKISVPRKSDIRV